MCKLASHKTNHPMLCMHGGSSFNIIASVILRRYEYNCFGNDSLHYRNGQWSTVASGSVYIMFIVIMDIIIIA